LHHGPSGSPERTTGPGALVTRDACRVGKSGERELSDVPLAALGACQRRGTGWTERAG